MPTLFAGKPVQLVQAAEAEAEAEEAEAEEAEEEAAAAAEAAAAVAWLERDEGSQAAGAELAHVAVVAAAAARRSAVAAAAAAAGMATEELGGRLGREHRAAVAAHLLQRMAAHGELRRAALARHGALPLPLPLPLTLTRWVQAQPSPSPSP